MRIASDADGSAVAVWRQVKSNRAGVWASRGGASGWSTPVLIDNGVGEASDPQVAANRNGEAIAVWAQLDNGVFSVWSNRLAAGGAWGVAEIVDSSATGDAFTPQVAIDASGNAVAVWVQVNGTRFDVWANRYVAGAGWTGATLIETDNRGDALDPAIALDDAGNALAVWTQSDGTRFNTRAARFVAASAAWEASRGIETDNRGDTFSPQIAIDASGRALAVWAQSDGTRLSIWSNRFDSDWQAAELIETDDTGSAFSPQIAISAAGVGFATWVQDDGAHTSVFAARYAPGDGWTGVALIEQQSQGDAFEPHIAVDPAGNALAVWSQRGATEAHVWANRYLAGSGWEGERSIENNSGNVLGPRVTLDASGRASAIWIQSDGAPLSVWANRFQ